jgi:hypothetical protein
MLDVSRQSLFVQAIFVSICLRFHGRFSHTRQGREPLWLDILLLWMAMLLTLLINFVQIAIWADIFMLGEFGDYTTSLSTRTSALPPGLRRYCQVRTPEPAGAAGNRVDEGDTPTTSRSNGTQVQ